MSNKLGTLVKFKFRFKGFKNGLKYKIAIKKNQKSQTKKTIKM